MATLDDRLLVLVVLGLGLGETVEALDAVELAEGVDVVEVIALAA
jgi:hypothetical protein